MPMRSWLGLAVATFVFSAAGAQEAKLKLDIKPQPIRLALQALGEQSGLQVLFRSEGLAIDGVISPLVAGEMSPQQALDRLLLNTGLRYEFINPHTVRVSATGLNKKPTSDIAPKSDNPEVFQGQYSNRVASADSAPPAALGLAIQDQKSAEHSDVTVQLDEIIVTARRKEEVLQDVAESVNVVSSQDLSNYNILQFTDIQKLVPGITLSQTGGYGSVASMRGVTYNIGQATPPTVQFYLNDAPINSTLIFLPTFDIGQIEVLRGPQGTIRGDISPSGAITLTTHRPDLQEFGGYASGSWGDRQDDNVQAAINLPLVEGKFAVRISGIRDENAVNEVRSTSNTHAPDQTVGGGRISARWTPTDDLGVDVTYQHLHKSLFAFGAAYEGNGAPGGIVPGTAFTAPPAGYNGPMLGLDQLLTVNPVPDDADVNVDDVNMNIGWQFLGQQLSYIGSWSKFRDDEIATVNGANSLPSYDLFQTTVTTENVATQEVRLSSVDRILGHLDYTLGFFFSYQNVQAVANEGPSFQSGAFGSPLANPVLGAPNLRYNAQSEVSSPNSERQYAGFLSLTYHFDEATELTAGVRWSADSHQFLTQIGLVPFDVAVPLPVPCAALAAAGFTGSTYPGTCDLHEALKPTAYSDSAIYHPVIYNAELSHRFNADVMAYLRAGSSYRPPNIQVGAAVFANSPAFQKYIFPDPERSQTYEAGLKTDFFDKRLEVDADYYHQHYGGLFYTGLPVYFLKTSAGAPSVSSFPFTTNADANVDGVELNALTKLTRNWTASGSFSWSDGRLADAPIPCNPSGGVPTVATFTAAGVGIFSCKSNASTSTSPRWNLNAESEYDQPITTGLHGFVRGLLYYYPSNPYASANVGYVVPSYATFDLFLGARRLDGGWEVSAYAKNLFNNFTITNLGQQVIAGASLGNFFGSSGYSAVDHVSLREFGVTARYAFGSR